MNYLHINIDFNRVFSWLHQNLGGAISNNTCTTSYHPQEAHYQYYRNQDDDGLFSGIKNFFGHLFGRDGRQQCHTPQYSRDTYTTYHHGAFASTTAPVSAKSFGLAALDSIKSSVNINPFGEVNDSDRGKLLGKLKSIASIAGNDNIIDPDELGKALATINPKLSGSQYMSVAATDLTNLIAELSTKCARKA